MKRLLIISLFVFVAVRASQAEIITVPFSAVVTQAAGMPFGIVAQVGVTQVTGSFKYDTTTPPFTDPVINGATFPARIASGLVMNVGGVTISSSDYTLDAVNHFDSSDIFRAIADPDGGGDFRVNGVPTRGSAEMRLTDQHSTFYATNADVDVLPTQAQLNQADFQFGFLSDALGTGGETANNLTFMTVPEPCALYLVAQALGLLLSRRFKRTPG
jgi:hypothetical protein